LENLPSPARDGRTILSSLTGLVIFARANPALKGWAIFKNRPRPFPAESNFFQNKCLLSGSGGHLLLKGKIGGKRGLKAGFRRKMQIFSQLHGKRARSDGNIPAPI